MKKTLIVVSLVTLFAFSSVSAWANGPQSNGSKNQHSSPVLTQVIYEAIQNNNLSEVISQQFAKGTNLSDILDSVASIGRKNTTNTLKITESTWKTIIDVSMAAGLSPSDVFNAGTRAAFEPLEITKHLLKAKLPATEVFLALDQAKIYANNKEALASFNQVVQELNLPKITKEAVSKAQQSNDQDAMETKDVSKAQQSNDQDALGYTPPGLQKSPAANKVAGVVLPTPAASSNPNAGSFASPSNF